MTEKTSSSPNTRLRQIRCPQCRTPVVWEDNPNRPFCSERCRLIDLACWADEEYRIPAEKTDEQQPEDVAKLPGKEESNQ